MIEENQVELLAPAGNAEGFYGAIHAGADAVYLGGSRFGARAYAENFTTEQLIECIRYAHLFGKKVYLTVNTLLKETELDDLYEYMKPFYEAGLDAVIVQDFGVFRCLRKWFPEMELHASTQMTLTSHYGAALLKEMGATRIVPARELSLQELIAIKKQVPIELETFIHGAMCYCYSGQCLFSSMIGGRSGNRGRCAQPCRLPFQVKNDNRVSETCYPLSLKDMCTIEHLPQLLEAGIDSFKIEGRMKKPEYTAGVTAIYRKYIDSYYVLKQQYGAEEAAKRYRVEKKDMEALSSLYIRSEKQDGYYFKHNGKEMVTLDSPAYSAGNEELLADIRNRYLGSPLKQAVSVSAVFETGKQAEVRVKASGAEAVVTGAVVEQAQKQPITEENIRKQLGKMGDSAFFAETIQVTAGKDSFYSLKQINELRRQAVAELEQMLLAQNGYKDRQAEPEERPVQLSNEKGQAVFAAQETAVFSVVSYAQLKSLTGWLVTNNLKAAVRIYVDADLLLEQTEAVIKLCRKLQEESSFFIALPVVFREADKKDFQQLSAIYKESGVFSGFLCRSLDEVQFVREQKAAYRLDANVYSWNSQAVRELGQDAEGLCVPLELKAGEQHRLLEQTRGISWEKTVYGRTVMMVTANCLMKTTAGCHKDSGTETVLIDRYQKQFPVRRVCRHCMNVIYNSVPFLLLQEAAKWREAAAIRLDFTVEDEKVTAQVLDAFFQGAKLPFKEYTTGHEKRGVE